MRLQARQQCYAQYHFIEERENQWGQKQKPAVSPPYGVYPYRLMEPCMDQILLRAEERTKRAFNVIQELGLFERWSRCGRPSLIGSVSFGLVVNRDIDLNVISKAPQIKQGFEVVSEIAALPGVLKIRYSNCLERIDQGLYWQIQYQDPFGDMWTVDNWLVSEDNPHTDLLETLVKRMRQTLNTEQRKAILHIKETTQPELKPRGIDIYEAVIEDSVRSPHEFAIWFRDRKQPEISQWLPRLKIQQI
jgi:hypothetical protein